MPRNYGGCGSSWNKPRWMGTKSAGMNRISMTMASPQMAAVSALHQRRLTRLSPRNGRLTTDSIRNE